ncbi:hypothetical protein M406DRAFT_285653 [Cryphonectria parasitica EP155]|uniref:Uncharacterized protein n=1 Tax=Cryphonectria parasitica (strain ATCC 38755 / EP155) TaxID=660469 RepID=A0A9P4YC76_CRYP1|nr:uncharacterized protein M406DRAFT_285653 [Cryphonectria parasitica EP155]KAF3770859.1 hypothetical protein M406DRAFT_285653 [Cryphonectria parasitica EP155]
MSDTGATYSQLTTTSNATAAAEIANALQFAASKSVRTSTVILASFNALAAFATAMGIIIGCRAYKKRMQRRMSGPPSGLFYIHTVEVFPLVLSLGITIQSTIFAAAQSVGLQALLSRGCTITAIFVLPALFLVPFTHLVFGVETAVRGVRSQFAPRGRWNVAKCLATVGILFLAALIVAAVDRTEDFCFASLFWFVRKYAVGCFGVFLGITVLQLIVIVTIFLQLHRGHMVDPLERVSASRMIYYLCLGFLSNAFIIPFFFSLTFLNQKKVILDTLNLSMAASVVANVNGIMVTGLHLFLRSQNKSTTGQKWGEYDQKSVYDRQDPRDSHRGSDHSLQPVNGRNETRGRADSATTLLHGAGLEDGRSLASPQGYGSAARNSMSPGLSISAGPQYPEPTKAPSEVSPSQIRKQSYSVFPQGPSSSSSTAAAVLPATTYSPVTSKPVRDTWKPPPIVKPWMGRSHKRDSSIVSTATVQIGIRLSNMDDYVPRKSTDTEVAVVTDVPPVPDVPPLHIAKSSPLTEAETQSPSASGSGSAGIVLENPPKRRSIWEARMKTLPPTPDFSQGSNAKPTEAGVAGGKKNEQDLATLSPAVYRPQEDFPQRSPSGRSLKKLPSPKGVGFNTPTGRSAGSENTPVYAPPRPSGSTAPTTLSNQEVNWI